MIAHKSHKAGAAGTAVKSATNAGRLATLLVIAPPVPVLTTVAVSVAVAALGVVVAARKLGELVGRCFLTVVFK